MYSEGAKFSVYITDNDELMIIECFHMMSQYLCHNICVTKKTLAMLVSKTNPVGFEIFSCVNYVNTFNFSSINLHGCRPHEKNTLFLYSYIYGVLC